MRTLIVIPHAFLPHRPGTKLYGSERTDGPTRAASLLRCIAALQQNFGPRQHMVNDGSDPRCNASLEAALEIVLCTTGADHLAGSVPPHLFHHHNTTLDPRLLGFACQGILRDNAGRYDWYGYLEDDCEITDPLWFAKLAWFNAAFGPAAALQPNRFELSTGPIVQKLYIDGPIPGPEPWGTMPGTATLQGTTLSRDWQFRRVGNPHAGCFFADPAQMARLTADPAFGHFSDAFIGPLESAATLPLLRNFAVYKPSLANAGFLEMRHIDQRILDQRLFFRFNAQGQVIRTVTEDGTAPPAETA
jgi:hypothetical protein